MPQFEPQALSIEPRRYQVSAGDPYPPGASVHASGVNFSVFSREATAIELLLFEAHDSPHPFQVIKLDVQSNRTFFFWHVFVEGLRAGVTYAYRVDGPTNLHGQGHRYDRGWWTRGP